MAKLNLKFFSKVMLVLSAIYLLIAGLQFLVFTVIIPTLNPDVSHDDLVAEMATQPDVTALNLFLFKHIYAVLSFNLAFAVALLVISYGFYKNRRWGLQAMLVLMWIQLFSTLAGVVAFAFNPLMTASALGMLAFSIGVGVFSGWVIRWLRRPEVRADFSS